MINLFCSSINLSDKLKHDSFVIKYFFCEILSFSDNGINIALNFRYKKKCEFLKNLDEFIISNNLINYICKDLRSNKESMKKIYKDEYVKFCLVLKKYLKTKIDSVIFS